MLRILNECDKTFGKFREDLFAWNLMTLQFGNFDYYPLTLQIFSRFAILDMVLGYASNFSFLLEDMFARAVPDKLANYIQISYHTVGNVKAGKSFTLTSTVTKGI